MGERTFIRERLRWLAGCLMETVREGLAAIAFAGLLLGLGQQPGVSGSDAARARVTVADERAGGAQAELAALPRDPRHRILAVYLSRHYGIAPDVAEEWVSAAHVASARMGVDPLVVLAVIAVESGFNPNAQSRAGAQGLMQVVPKYHEDKLEEHGGTGAVFDPTVNILVGTRILEQYIRRMGSLEAGLQRYNGASSDATARYAHKVLAERERLQFVIHRFEETLAVL
jgi:soluble lytic murein transglycosylase-like protein